MTILRRAAAAIAVVGLLSLQAGAVCAGWQSSPDARMTCCAPEAGCPMQASATPPGHADHAAGTDADVCCAMSEPGRAAREIPSTASPVVPVLDGATLSAFQPVIAPRLSIRPATPTHSGVARHVLLSVFIV